MSDWTLQEWAHVGEIITGIGTIAALIISGIAVKEVKKQREQSYLPLLVIEPTTIFYVNDADDPLSGKYSITEGKELLRPALKLSNLGLGAAHGITLQWSFSAEEIINTIRSLHESSDLQIEHNPQEAWYSGESYMITSPSGNRVGFLLIWQGVQHFQEESFYLPFKVSGSSYKVKFPPSYLGLYGIYLYYVLKRLWVKHDQQTLFMKDFPPCYLSISYRDAANIKQRQKFKFVIDPRHGGQARNAEEKLLMNHPIKISPIPL